MLVPENEQLPEIEQEKHEKIKFYMQNSKSKNTQKSYTADGSILPIGAKEINAPLFRLMSAQYAFTFRI
ncbi:hypothetical protein [Bacillus sp. MUM 13]|uniref:hypothetical protein n=1 Tax=Bacillus sp. MUM 13 TaxID=1678001 RepID=UPI0009F44D18|nr:hypothetical protein [Bacillus sp. MUM 13]